MNAVSLSDLKKGEFFTRKPIVFPTEKQVYIRDSFERSSKKYSCISYADSCKELFLKGSTIVYIDFEF